MHLNKTVFAKIVIIILLKLSQIKTIVLLFMSKMIGYQAQNFVNKNSKKLSKMKLINNPWNQLKLQIEKTAILVVLRDNCINSLGCLINIQNLIAIRFVVLPRKRIKAQCNQLLLWLNILQLWNLQKICNYLRRQMDRSFQI